MFDGKSTIFGIFSMAKKTSLRPGCQKLFPQLLCESLLGGGLRERALMAMMRAFLFGGWENNGKTTGYDGKIMGYYFFEVKLWDND